MSDRVKITLGLLVFSALGLLLAVEGSGWHRGLGVALVLFFGFGGAFALGRATGGAPAAVAGAPEVVPQDRVRTEDSAFAFYGVRYDLDPDDDAALDGDDPRAHRAAKAGLEVWNGRHTDGDTPYLYVGALLGRLALGGPAHVVLDPDALQQAMARVHRQLADAGLDGAPALHLQFECNH